MRASATLMAHNALELFALLMGHKPQEGLFGLRAWIEEGFFPDGWSGSASGVAPFKKRNAAPKDADASAKVGNCCSIPCTLGQLSQVGLSSCPTATS
eukprot:1160934-Pelagomonas_calceolata.AAC.4